MFYKKRRGKSIYSVFSETQESPNPAGSHSRIIPDTWLLGHHRPAIHSVRIRLSQVRHAHHMRSVQPHSVRTHSPWHLDRERRVRILHSKEFDIHKDPGDVLGAVVLLRAFRCQFSWYWHVSWYYVNESFICF